MPGQDHEARDIVRLRHDPIFLGGSHDLHERRTRWVVALTALTMVAGIVRHLATAADEAAGHR